jgi:hypothetical protein
MKGFDTGGIAGLVAPTTKAMIMAFVPEQFATIWKI